MQPEIQEKLRPSRGRGKLVTGVFLYNMGFAILLDSNRANVAWMLIIAGACLFIFGFIENLWLVRKFKAQRREARSLSSSAAVRAMLFLFLTSATLLGSRLVWSEPEAVPAAETNTQVEVPIKVDEKTVAPVVDAAPKGILSPTAQIKSVDELLKGYHKGKKLSETQVSDNLKIKNQVLKDDFNLSELCRLALASHWAGLSANQRNEFVQVFTSLLLRNAILHSEKHTGKEKIDYLSEAPIKELKGRTLVKTRIEVPEEAVDFDVDYAMMFDAAKKRWRIYDLILDGESLMENYKQQFHTIIAKNSYSGLVKRMRSKLAEGKADQSLKAVKAK